MRFESTVKTTIISLGLLGLSACSNDGGGGGVAPTTPPVVVAPTPTSSPTPAPLPSNLQLSYVFISTGCTTGSQVFPGKKEYCDGLLNDSLNNNCAREMRTETYNRFCTGAVTTNPGQILPSSAGRCVVNAMDLKDRDYLENLNIFNPQRRQSIRDMYWEGRMERAFDLTMMGSDTYGRARFTMIPAQGPRPAQGEIQVRQRRGEDVFSARSGLGGHLQLVVTNYRSEKEMETSCVTDPAFKRPATDSRLLRCDLYSRALDRREEVALDLRSSQQKELFRNRHNESVIVRIKPAAEGIEERLVIEAIEMDKDKTVKAEASLSEGLELSYASRSSSADFRVACRLASK